MGLAPCCRGILFSFCLLTFALPLSAEETKPKTDTKESAPVGGIGMAVVDAHGGLGDESRPDAEGVTITDEGWQVEQDPAKPEDRTRIRRFHIRTGGPWKYSLTFSLPQKKDPEGEWQTIRSELNMQDPCYGNWFSLSDLVANGRSIHDRDGQADVEVVETGARGMIDFHWEHPLVVARTRFIADPGADHLLMEVRWKPRGNLKSLALQLDCYPQGFGVAWEDHLNGLKRERCITTPVRDIPQVRKANANPANEWWFLYHDLTLEKTRRGNSFSSPCALLVLPEDLGGLEDNSEPVHLDVGDYTVSTVVDLDPGGGRARFALWDGFGDQTFSQSKAHLLAEAAGVRERMAKGSWLPAAVQNLNIAAERSQVENLARQLGKKGAERLNALRQQIERLATQQQALATGSEPISAERELNSTLARYRTLRWQAERPVRKEVRTLVLAGPTAYAWQVEKIAKKRWGSNSVRRGAHNWRYWIGHRVNYFPGTLAELYSYDVVVLADFPRYPLAPDQQQWLADFVSQGGGLLILGGYYAYAAGGWNESPLASIFPVDLNKNFNLQPIKGDHLLKAVKNAASSARAPLILPPPDRDLGAVFWRHNLKPREGATVWLTAGGEPFAISGAVGEGRVIALLGAALGEAPKGQTAFWDSPGWPPLLERILEYLARGP